VLDVDCFCWSNLHHKIVLIFWHINMHFITNYLCNIIRSSERQYMNARMIEKSFNLIKRDYAIAFVQIENIPNCLACIIAEHLNRFQTTCTSSIQYFDCQIWTCLWPILISPTSIHAFAPAYEIYSLSTVKSQKNVQI
jgi:hypothetical protein